MRAVIFGAGNIGRGFIGQTCSKSGYLVTFVEASPSLVEALNETRAYPVQIVSDETIVDVEVGPVEAILASDLERVAAAVAGADLMATAVGVGALPKIAPALAAGFHRRWADGKMRPLDVIVCENKIDADRYLFGLVQEHLEADDRARLGQLIGFVEASIGRMVPVMPEALRKEHPLLVQVEPYSELPVDADGFRGPIPHLIGLCPFAPFDFYIERKLFVHNLGHAMTAYLGWLLGLERIAEAISDPRIRPWTERAMTQSAQALAQAYAVPFAELEAHVQDLLRRFANRRLGDRIDRVGKDPLRKLSRDDRLAGALRLVLKQEGDPSAIALGLAAGTLFQPADDEAAQQMQTQIRENGVDAFLQVHTGLTGTPELDFWRRQILLLRETLIFGLSGS